MKGPLLVILPHNPGDVVMALAAITRIRSNFPELEIDYVVGEECRALVEGSPLLRRVLAIPRQSLLDSWSAGDVAAVISRVEAFLATLDSSGYAYSLNLFQERFGGILQGLIRADRKAGLELAEGRIFRVGSRFLEHLFAIPASRRDNGWHAVDIYLRAARDLLDPEKNFPWAPPRARTPALPTLHPPPGWDGPAPKTFLSFHPGSAWPGKRWPEGHWAALAVACARAGVATVLTGSSEEKPSMGRILARIPPEVHSLVHDWSGRTTFLGAAWIHSQARMTVTGDTVAMHLAAMTGTPTLSLFGPSNPVESGPYGSGHFILQTELEIPADMVLGREHSGLSCLDPGAVAGFILNGTPPPATALWETAWDSLHDRLMLRDARGLLHPHQRRAARLMDLLDGKPIGVPAINPRSLAQGPRSEVWECLGRCLSDSMAAQDLIDLEAADRGLAEATRDSVVWEAYRIAINGLSLTDIRQHLKLRGNRFERALQEENTLSMVPED